MFKKLFEKVASLWRKPKPKYPITSVCVVNLPLTIPAPVSDAMMNALVTKATFVHMEPIVGERHDDGSVTTPKGFKAAYKALVEGGWVGLAGLLDQAATAGRFVRDAAIRSALPP